MVILVRCHDGVFSLALQSRLHDLISEGLVSEFLQEGEWLSAEPVAVKRDQLAPALHRGRLAAVVSSF